MTRLNGARKIFGLAVAGLAMAVTLGHTHAETLKLIESWGPSSLSMVFAVDTVSAEVKRLSNGALDIRRFGPEVVPPFEQLQPVSSGTFDMLYTHPIYHAGATAIGALMDIVVADSETRRAAGLHDWIDT